MKQHITKSQLDELSEDNYSLLHVWYLDHTDIKETRYAYPLLSIGQMIEFLDEHYGAWKMESWQDWVVMNQENNVNKILAEEKELCDALWDAVKEILNKAVDNTK